MSEHEVVHQPERQRFVVTADGADAFVEYRMLAPEVIDLVHSSSPAQLLGLGLAGE